MDVMALLENGQFLIFVDPAGNYLEACSSFHSCICTWMYDNINIYSQSLRK